MNECLLEVRFSERVDCRQLKSGGLLSQGFRRFLPGNGVTVFVRQKIIVAGLSHIEKDKLCGLSAVPLFVFSA